MVTRSAASVGRRPPNDLEEIRSFVFRTGDPDHLAEQLAPVAPDVHIQATVATGFAAQVRAWKLPRIGFLSMDMSHGRTRFASERDFFVLTVPLAEEVKICSGRRAHGYAPGSVHVSSTDEPFDCRHPGGSRFLGASLDSGLVRSHARALEEDGRARAPSLSRLFSSGAKCTSFLHYLRWLSQELRQEGSALAVPRVAWEADDLLVAMLLEACRPPDSAREKADCDALRRAEEFLAEHMQTAVSLPEVAAVAGVSLRTLTRAFHEKYGVGPIGFLRQRRLHAARRDLLSALPGSESVTHVALRYGFAHLGRFAGEYRKAFGEYPSETLCR